MLLNSLNDFWSGFHLGALIDAYIPLLLWTGVGLIFSRFAPQNASKIFGVALYWVGVPWQLFVLARHTEFSDTPYIPYVAIASLIISWLLALIGWQFAKQEDSDRSSLGSFILATMLGNTGFVGLTLTNSLTSANYADWAVLYSITSNVAGNYGIAVFIASYFGKSEIKPPWWKLLLDVATVPSLWAFAVGWYTRPIALPDAIESGLDVGVWVTIAFALSLVGLRLGKIEQWTSIKPAAIAAFLRVAIVPLAIGLVATAFGLRHDPRLILTLMSGTPTGLSVLILAEVYNLDRDLLISTIAFSFVGIIVMLPVWIICFG
ncbi:AEC family transporter [Pseudanabaena sp. 'Roaring Creek']|uniref:AEC family transporter n=1 Tax=Pseudanabaena sp. 'Roaring Creek' TaxID=1681830 RepID=UPI0006D79184|nr:AEC family transporter [Pseudanabaena sp. 'Roaring Creek']